MKLMYYLKPGVIKSRIACLFGVYDIETVELHSNLITIIIGLILLLLPTVIPQDSRSVIPDNILPPISDILGLMFICLSSIKLAALLTSNHVSLRKNISLVLALAYVWLVLQFLGNSWHRLFLLVFLPQLISNIWIYIRLLKLHINILKSKNDGTSIRANI